MNEAFGDPLWWGIVITIVGCYALKIAGLSVPDSLLDHPVVRRTTALLPVGLLGALVAVQVLADGSTLRPDARVAGLAVAAVLLALRLPFLVVVVAAALTAALLRL